MINKIVLLCLIVSGLSANKMATYVGDASCVQCHTTQTEQWKGSHHDMAMMLADEYSVKADFNNSTFNYNGIISTFYKNS